ncbi:MAG: ribonuclease R [Acholeplasmatales bacterium]|nr:ribonuclease R [Acholeplasmatales bacterium]
MNNEELVLDALSKPYCHMVMDINKITNMSKTEIKSILDKLIREDKVALINKLYYLKKSGVIEVKDKGFGFIKVDGEEDEYYVERGGNNGAYTGDTVSFYILPRIGRQKKDTAIVLNILKHSNEFIYGELIEKKTKKGTRYQIISANKDFDVKATVNFMDLNGAVPGNIVVGKLSQEGTLFKAEVTRIVGHKDDPGVDISLVALEFGFEPSYPLEVMAEAIALPEYVDVSKYPKREDFTKDKVITIDGDDSKDFDDAICVKKLSNGNYRLYVHIADVSEYVFEDSELDKEAFKRGTSVYLADRVIAMLPHTLSNGICSLNEGVERLVLSCIMDLDPDGRLIKYEIKEGIIKSLHRMTYNKVNKMLEGDKELIDEYSDIYPMILDCKELADKIRARRVKGGALDFDVPEYAISLNDKGEPISFKLRERGPAELLIEDFMLKANETVAYHMSMANLPCVYRIHETPDQEKLHNTLGFIERLGYKIPKTKNDILPSELQKLMNTVKEQNTDYFVVNQMMLRSMMKAKYSEECVGHYGLALQYYCHFTSPIRRYPDLMTHRLIKKLMLHPSKKNFDKDYMHFMIMLHEVCVTCSEQERKSIECEREVDDMLMAQYMSNHIGESYKGVINSITQFGMFVTIDGGIEGLVHISNMNGFFVFDDKTMSLSSYRRTYTIGDRVDIVVIGASKKDRAVDFILKEDMNKEVYYGYGSRK